MPTPSRGPRLGGSPQHERLILRNLAQSLFEHGRISTTEAKAKRLRPFAEKLITHAKRGDLHARREALKVIRDKSVVHKLFAEIGPSFATRIGGYTRIVKTAPRKGDNAPMAIIELVREETVSSAASRVARRAASTRATAAPSPTTTTATTTATDAAVTEPVEKDATGTGAVPTDVTETGATETDAIETGANGTEATEPEIVQGADAAEGADDPDSGTEFVTQAEQAAGEEPAEGAVEATDQK